MSKQKLDLLQLATGTMAEPRAVAPKIMRREFLNSGTRRGGSEDLPQHLRRHAPIPALSTVEHFLDSQEFS